MIRIKELTAHQLGFWLRLAFPRRPMQSSADVVRDSPPPEALMRCRDALNMGRAVPHEFPSHLFTP